MTITTYTNYETIRALLGVGRFEIKDETLALPLYANQFQLEMEDLDSGAGAAQAEYDRIATLARTDRNVNEARYFMLVNMFAGYVVAKELLATAPMFAPKRMADGKASAERVEDPYSVQREGVEGGYMEFRSRLQKLLLVLVPTANLVTTPTRVFASSVGVSVDPVTGV